MPARKPQGLKARHDTAADKAARVEAEESMTPKKELPENPVQLKGHRIAAAAYRRLRRIYDSLEARIVNAMDYDTMIDVCIGIEQLDEIDGMRASARKNWESLNRMYCRISDMDNVEPDQLLRAAELVNAAYDKITKLDARCDQKRKMLHTLRQSLYLTPRSRAATNPKQKEKEAPVDPFENLLDGVPDFLANGSRDDIA